MPNNNIIPGMPEAFNGGAPQAANNGASDAFSLVGGRRVYGGRRVAAVGSRRMVYSGTAKHTSGGLTKKDLMMNSWGRIVSRKKHNTAKRENRLKKHGWGAKKGKFGAVRMSAMRKSPVRRRQVTRRRRRRR